MTNTTGFNTGAPVFSPEFSDMIDRCVDLLKLDIVQGLAFEQEPGLLAARGVQSSPSSLGGIVARRMTKAKPGGKRGRSATASPDSLLSALYTADIRTLARRYNVDVSSAKAVTTQVDVARDFAFLTPELASEKRMANQQDNLFDLRVDEDADQDASTVMRRLAPSLAFDPTVLRMLADNSRSMINVAIGGAIGGLPVGGLPGGTVSQPIVVNKGLEFRLHQVKCIDETNPEWPGDDEISMGGTAVPPTGTPTKIGEFSVGTSFDDGESKYYSPPRLLKTFSLTGVSYPAEFLVVLGMAEKDNGGLSDFLNDMWEAIKNHVQAIVTAVGAAAGLAIGTTIGGSIGTAIGGPLGTIIGAVAGAILGALVGWLISAIKDDIFTPQSAAVALPSHNATFAGGALTSPTFSVNFRDHGGHYRVFYSWKINR